MEGAVAHDPDFERKHPRDPDDGRFVDTPGGDWADKIAGRFSDEVLDQTGPDRLFTPDQAAEIHRQLEKHKAGMRQLGETVRQTREYLDETAEMGRRPVDTSRHAEFERDQREFEQKRLKAEQERREDLLFAFNPIGGYRQKLTELYDQLGIDDKSAIEEYLSVLDSGAGLPRPTEDHHLDYGLSQYVTQIETLEEAQQLRARIIASGRDFPDTMEMLDNEIDLLEDDD